jgi:protein-S-isoprenylcysteine O-methyltransferase Ste14
MPDPAVGSVNGVNCVNDVNDVNGVNHVNDRLLRLAQIGGTTVAVASWYWLANQRLGGLVDALVAVGGAVLLAPVVWIGRRALDARPTVGRAAWVTTWVHTAFGTLTGSAIIGATRAAMAWTGWQLPVAPELGMAVAVAGSLGAVAAMLTLALQGRGAPWAIALSRRVAAGGVYQWTRNPMVLSGLIGLVGLGLWLGSPILLLWTLAVLLPCAVVFLKYFEERELEIRLGVPYLEYRAKTPMLWPRRPRS